MPGSKNHMESCRRCGNYVRQDLAIPARKVLGRSSARGWYCVPCRDTLNRLEDLLKGERLKKGGLRGG